jgi:hypothetical protein
MGADDKHLLRAVVRDKLAQRVRRCGWENILCNGSSLLRNNHNTSVEFIYGRSWSTIAVLELIVNNCEQGQFVRGREVFSNLGLSLFVMLNLVQHLTF